MSYSLKISDNEQIRQRCFERIMTNPLIALTTQEQFHHAMVSRRFWRHTILIGIKKNANVDASEAPEFFGRYDRQARRLLKRIKEYRK